MYKTNGGTRVPPFKFMFGCRKSLLSPSSKVFEHLCKSGHILFGGTLYRIRLGSRLTYRLRLLNRGYGLLHILRLLSLGRLRICLLRLHILRLNGLLRVLRLLGLNRLRRLNGSRLPYRLLRLGISLLLV